MPHLRHHFYSSAPQTSEERVPSSLVSLEFSNHLRWCDSKRLMSGAAITGFDGFVVGARRILPGEPYTEGNQAVV